MEDGAPSGLKAAELRAHPRPVSAGRGAAARASSSLSSPTHKIFCWPPALWLERPTPHAFATTTNSGTRRFGFVIGWVETLSASLVTHSALVLLASTPIEWLYFEVLQLAHERIAGATGAAGI